jgi:hypothetical protein
MIDIKRSGSNLMIEVGTNLGVRYPLYYQCNDEQYAMLLRDHMQIKMANKLEEIRREAYEQGWNDHKKRKTKATWFKGFW